MPLDRSSTPLRIMAATMAHVWVPRAHLSSKLRSPARGAENTHDFSCELLAIEGRILGLI